MKANSKEYQVIRSHGLERIKSKDLRVGDIVKVEGGDRVPADLIALYSDNDQGTLFLKTDQLDGETDWKLRKAVKMTQSLVRSEDDYSSLCSSNLQCRVKYKLWYLVLQRVRSIPWKDSLPTRPTM